MTLSPEKQIPFHWSDASLKDKHLTISLNGYGWSGGFSIDAPIATALKLKNSKDSSFYFSQLNVQTETNATYVVLSPESQYAPYMIKNDTNMKIYVNQKVGIRVVMWNLIQFDIEKHLTSEALVKCFSMSNWINFLDVKNEDF